MVNLDLRIYQQVENVIILFIGSLGVAVSSVKVVLGFI
jgi:hypothetical protein